MIMIRYGKVRYGLVMYDKVWYGDTLPPLMQNPDLHQRLTISVRKLLVIVIVWKQGGKPQNSFQKYANLDSYVDHQYLSSSSNTIHASDKVSLIGAVHQNTMFWKIHLVLLLTTGGNFNFIKGDSIHLAADGLLNSVKPLPGIGKGAKERRRKTETVWSFAKPLSDPPPLWFGLF